MEPNKKLFEVLLERSKEKGDVAEYLTKELQKYDSIRTQLGIIDRDEHREIEKLAAARKKFKDERERIYKTCDHPVTNYQADPAGGSDSSETCVICGMELDRSLRRAQERFR